MGLKDLFSRWSKSEDQRAIEKAEQESRMSPYGRDVDSEDFESRKDDLQTGSTIAGAGAEAAARDDLD